MRGDLCVDRGTVRRGALWLAVDWELFSTRDRQVVLRFTQESSLETTSAQDMIDFLLATVKANVRNLLANPKFHAQAAQRGNPAKPGQAPTEALAIASRHSGGGTVAARMPELQSAVATVFAGAGSGTGFYLSAEGWWLTNHHVVGDARYVRLRLANGRELNGEVVRSAARRDVALIRTEPVALLPMVLAEGELGVGSEVTAIGSPLGERFASSVARGIVSNYRDIEEQRWLQSDVQVLPGSSGGPLVSSEGAVVGLTSRGVQGVVLFVPIREALQALNLGFAPAPR
jgi:S1-C subfamily serine protease